MPVGLKNSEDWEICFFIRYSLHFFPIFQLLEKKQQKTSFTAFYLHIWSKDLKDITWEVT